MIYSVFVIAILVALPVFFLLISEWYKNMLPKEKEMTEVDMLVKEVVEFYKGRSIYETSEKFNLSPRHVLQILTKEGVFEDT